MKRNTYSAEFGGVVVKITEKQFDRLWAHEVLELLIKKGLPIENDFDNVSAYTGTNQIPYLNCFKRTGKPNYHNGIVTQIKLTPLWLCMSK